MKKRLAGRIDTLETYEARYGVHAADVADEVERAVIGGVFGANGYTTLKQANQLIEALALDEESRLLDIGAGRGWPGLYIGGRTCCEVVLADMPEAGLRTALAKVGLRDSPRAHPVRCAGEALPLRRETFDAVVHTDTL